MSTLLQSLQHQTFVFNTQSAITELPDMTPFSAHLIDANTFELQVNNALTLNEAFSLLSKHGIMIQSMRNKTNRLEELFMDLIKNGH